MPIYEYLCQGCRRRFSRFFKSFSTIEDVSCPACNSGEVSRLISTVAVIRSEESRMESMSDSSWMGDVDQSDPRSMAQWARRMGAEMGEDMGPEWSEMVDRMEAGEMPSDPSGEGHSHDDFGM